MEVSQNEASQPNEDSSSAKAEFSYSMLVKKRFFWPAFLAVVLVVVLVVSLVVALTRSSDNEDSIAIETETSSSSSPKTAETETVRLDSDGDGLFDDQEIEGWRTKDGSVYKTDPFSADTDGDGLTDLEEAGQLLTQQGSEGLTYQGVSNPLKIDSDDDGLEDTSELKGWVDTEGKKYRTNPLDSDTDKDGLSDGFEAGKAVTLANGHVGYELLSDPARVDSDNDGLHDAEELNQDTDPFLKDTDGDGLSDGDEVLTIGTDPKMTDSDGDSFNDYYELQHMNLKSLDPLRTDEKMTILASAKDFAIGAVFGNLRKRDTIPWLVGSLTVTGLGMLKVVPNQVKNTVRIRDLVVAAINQDWVGAGYAAARLLPFIGDAQEMKKIIQTFVERTDHLETAVSKFINKIPLIGDEEKMDLRRAAWGVEWSNLDSHGLKDSQINQLAVGGNSLRDVRETMGVSTINESVVPFRSNSVAEKFLANELKLQGHHVESQAIMSTNRCGNGSNPLMRSHDIHVEMPSSRVMAVEVKTGYVLLSDTVKMQIESDLCLRKQGEISEVRWEFMPSASTGQVGPSPELREYLKTNDIEIAFRAPS
ncbi:hypothetical protein [Corynebacterium glutamicum]|uniref:hypothetical protein n=1 Tax=Corynebacterium glutamicum TaxID=1718 RepID=UPI000941CD84|nr:hypothetical protein [Corynebacterium glutamicum]OKX90851.1 hypothetical protein AUP72_09190 [Corynebacterium glutamicum]